MSCQQHPNAEHDQELGCWACWFRVQTAKDNKLPRMYEHGYSAPVMGIKRRQVLGGTSKCAYRNCKNEFRVVQTGGRPMKYCSDQCRFRENTLKHTERRKRANPSGYAARAR